MMEREIKFRCWDRLLKKMFYDISFIHVKDSMTYSIYENKTGKYFASQAVIMQFIGLFDMNGEEIYEGDLIDDDGIVMTVRFVRDQFRKCNEHDSWGIHPLDQVEVIGNVYEGIKKKK